MKLNDSIRASIVSAGGTPRAHSLRGLLRELLAAYGGTTFPDNDNVLRLLRACVTASGGTPTSHKIRGLFGQLVIARGGTVTGSEDMAALGVKLAATIGLGFTPQTGVALSSPITSNTITMSGLSGSPAMTITGGQYSKNGGAYSSGATTITNGDTVNVKLTSSASNSTATTATLTINGVAYVFSVTTLALVISLGALTLNGSLTLNVAASGVTITGALADETITLAGANAGLTVQGPGTTTRTVTGTPTSSGAITATQTSPTAVNSPRGPNALGTVSAAPSLPSGLVFDLDASAITGLADGDLLTSWADSVNAITVTDPGGKAPTYKAAGGTGSGGKAYVDFTAGTKYLTCASASQGALKTAIDSADYSLVLVASHVGSSGNGNPVFTFGNSGTILSVKLDGTVAGTADTSATPTSYPWPASSSYVSFGVTSTASAPERGGTLNPLRRHFMRGLPFGANKSTGGNTGTTGILGVGGRSDGVVISKCRLYRVLVFNRKLTPAEMWQVEQAMNTIYAQTHPTTTLGKVYVFDGDSRTAGEGMTGSNANGGFMWNTLNLLTSPPPAGCVANFAIGGMTIAQCQSKSSEMDYIGTIGVPVRAYYEEAYNSKAVAVATMASQTTAHFTYMRSIFGGTAKFVGASPMDHLNSQSPQFSDNANPTLATDASWGGYVRNHWAALGMDAMVDQLVDSYIGYDQFTTVQSSPSGYGPILPDAVNRPAGTDGVHLTTAGQLWQAGLTATVMNAISGW